jgi:hypothetical protein
MFLTERDYQICLRFAHFGFLKTAHVRALEFPENKSNTSSYRRLDSLVTRRYLKRIERRLIGGNRGGSGQHVYCLDFLGKRLFPSDSYMLPRMQDVEHTLAIADACIAALDYKQNGRYEVVKYTTEPRDWLVIKGVNLRPDLYIEFGDNARRQAFTWWIEVDLAHQRDDVIRDKLERYYHVWKHSRSDEFTMESFPRVVFLVPHEERRDRIRSLISKQPQEAHHLFRVELAFSFPKVLLEA